MPILRSTSKDASDESLDNTRSATSGYKALILLASSMPSITGIIISSIITSGFNWGTISKASLPLLAVPTISIPLPESIDAIPISMSGWSSTNISLTSSPISFPPPQVYEL